MVEDSKSKEVNRLRVDDLEAISIIVDTKVKELKLVEKTKGAKHSPE